jgi:cellulose synthase/poly-beta-1,6-N-acetylglucosamine synthase-like glycosyltransferase
MMSFVKYIRCSIISPKQQVEQSQPTILFEKALKRTLNCITIKLPKEDLIKENARFYQTAIEILNKINKLKKQKKKPVKLIHRLLIIRLKVFCVFIASILNKSPFLFYVIFQCLLLFVSTCASILLKSGFPAFTQAVYQNWLLQ